MTEEEAYKSGREARIEGPNETNCQFSIFANIDWSEAWQRGYDDALEEQSQEEADG